MVELNTSLLGGADITASSIVTFAYAGKNPPRYPSSIVWRIANAIVFRADEFGFTASGMASQIGHETGWFWSRVQPNQVQPSQYNFAGLGATNDGAAGHTFSDPESGVLAVFCHRALYTYGHPDNWPEHLRKYAELAIRLEAVESAGYLGVVKAYGDFTNGRWAWTPKYPKDTLLNGYAQALVDGANALIKLNGQTMNATLASVPGVNFRVSLIPAGNGNRPALPMVPEWITVHNTANYNVGANAEMHRAFTHNGGGSEEVSFHFVVDDTEIIQLLPLNENGWHAGDGYDGPGNRKSVAIEMCDNADGDFAKTFDNLCRLVAALRRELSLSNEAVQHNKWSGKDCPRDIRHKGLWPVLLGKVNEYMGTPEPPAYVFAGDTHAMYFEETGHHLSNGFRGYWQGNGALQEFGFPLTEEFVAPDSGLATQVFQRYVLEYDGNAPEDWRVRGRLYAWEQDGVMQFLDLKTLVPAGAWAKVPR